MYKSVLPMSLTGTAQPSETPQAKKRYKMGICISISNI